MFVLSVLGGDRPGPALVAVMALVVVLFKIAGLYDRDELRLAHSTLDEAPLLVQLTGLYALSVTIVQPLLIDGPPRAPARSPRSGSPASSRSWAAA